MITFERLTMMPTRIGVLESPRARRTVEKITDALRKSIGRYRIIKYFAVISRMAGSTCIRAGTMGLRDRVSTVKNAPAATAAKMDCAALHPYNGKYQGQTGATGSRVFQDAEIQ